MGGYDLNKIKQEQIKYAKKLIIKDDFEEIKLIAGIDQAYHKNKIISAIVVLEFPSMKIIEKKYSITDSKMPYIPGFMGYRESAVVIDAFNKLENQPDLLMFDANGILHPRKFGLASQVALSLDKPAIGVTKKLICGEVKDDKILIEDDVRGKMIKIKEQAKPLIVNPAHKISIRSAVDFVMKTNVPPHKQPEPLHVAHRFADKIRKNLVDEDNKNTQPEITQTEVKDSSQIEG
ncbi:endonuclease V [Nanoarchaeota archaeon]